jgi:hypothetical protein
MPPCIGLCMRAIPAEAAPAALPAASKGITAPYALPLKFELAARHAPT